MAVLLVGLCAAGAASLSARLADASLRAVGYMAPGGAATRDGWVEAYDYVQGLWWARRVAREVAPARLPDEERVTRLAMWVFDHFIGRGVSMPIKDDHFFSVARRGYGYCDQLAHILATLYWSAGYPARLLMLRDAQGISNHTVTEVRVKGRWILIDPSYKIVFRDRQGRLLSVADLAACPDALEAYRIDGVSRLTVEDFQRGTVFATPPYVSIGGWLSKIAQHVQRSPMLARAAFAPAEDASLHGRDPVAVQGQLAVGCRRLDRARRLELVNDDARAGPVYLDIVQDPRVPGPVRTVARYWLARLMWRCGDGAGCLTQLELFASSVAEEPWQSATKRLQGWCKAKSAAALAARFRQRDVWGGG